MLGRRPVRPAGGAPTATPGPDRPGPDGTDPAGTARLRSAGHAEDVSQPPVTEAQETATQAAGAGHGQGAGRRRDRPGRGPHRRDHLVSNIVGFGRQLVFAHTVSATCLGTAYATQPGPRNIIYDIVLGGALASVLIPVLAGPAARRLGEHPVPGRRRKSGQPDRVRDAVLDCPGARPGERDHRRGGEAAGHAAARGPRPRCAHAAIVGVSTRMLVVFAPQILLYGLAVVLYGILQAHRRLPPRARARPVQRGGHLRLLAFVPLSQVRVLAGLPRSAELMLSVGTTAGVAALVLNRAGPGGAAAAAAAATLRFPAGVAAPDPRLAAVGLITLIARTPRWSRSWCWPNGQEGQAHWSCTTSAAGVLRALRGARGAIATTAFPVLGRRRGARFDETAAASTRAIMLFPGWAPLCWPVLRCPRARLFTHSPADARQLAYTFAAFAPGLSATACSTHLSRVLFADRPTGSPPWPWWPAAAGDRRGRSRGLLVPDWWVVPVLVGQLDRPDRVRPGAAGRGAPGAGGAALRGTARAALAGLAGAVVGAAAGAALSSVLPARASCPRRARASRGGGVTLVFGGAALRWMAGTWRAVLARGRAMVPGFRLGRAEATVVTGRDQSPGRAAVSYLLAASAGGTGRHVAMLAGGCAARAPRSTCTGAADANPRVPARRRAAGLGDPADASRTGPYTWTVGAPGGRSRRPASRHAARSPRQTRPSR